MERAGTAKIPLQFDSIKVRTRLPKSSAIHREMDADAMVSQIWLAMKQADDAGFDEFVDPLVRLHQQAVHFRRSLASV